MIRKKHVLPITLIFFTALLSACLTVPRAPKAASRGTSTSTPFQPAGTFTNTPEITFTPLPSATLQPSPTSSGVSPTASGTTPAGTATQTTPTASPEPTLTSPPTDPASPTPQPTKGSSGGGPVVRVSVTTNCRTGPGVGYTRISSLAPGRTAKIVGRNPLYPYWVIQDPWGSGRSCWLWNYYASAEGATSDLPVVDPPAAPTALPTASSTPSSTPDPDLPSATPRPPTNTPTQVPPTETSPPVTPTNTAVPGTPTDTSTPAPTATSTPVPPPSPTPDSPYCSYTSVLTVDEEKILNKINRARRDHGLPALQVDSRLVTAARNHGRDMTCHGTYGHTSTDGTRAWERISMALGHGPNWFYNHCCAGEIFYGGSGGLTPGHAFTWWMTHESQDPDYEDNIHKRTILSQYTTHIGVGAIYYYDGSRTMKFYTVDFARP